MALPLAGRVWLGGLLRGQEHERVEIARRLVNSETGMNIDVVATATKMKPEEVERLKA